LADRGAKVVGWEASPQNAEVARLISDINGVHVSFVTKELNAQTAGEISQNHYDAAIILSVFHHIIRFQGLEKTKLITKNLLERIPVLYVELAKKGEDPSLPWDKYQPEDELEIFKGLDVKIKKLGMFDNHLSSKKRPLYRIHSKKSVKVNAKEYNYDKVTFSAYSNSPIRRYGSLKRKYYFSDKYVIKEYGLATENEKELNTPEAYQEISALRTINRLSKNGSLRHSYPKLIDAEINEKLSRFVIEKTEGELLSDLAVILSNESDAKEKVALNVARSTLAQLTELHQNGIYHNDIRSWNIIVNDKGTQLIDFGNSSGIAAEDDTSALLWALYDFLNDTREANGKAGELPPEGPFKPYKELHDLYMLISKGQKDPAALHKKLKA
jgi:O-antigen chain-terminating methyltransferase